MDCYLGLLLICYGCLKIFFICYFRFWLEIGYYIGFLSAFYLVKNDFVENYMIYKIIIIFIMGYFIGI